MYKLLTTTAIIIATASSASAWDGAENLIENLNTVYQGVDGGAHFTNLTNGGGELNTFLSDVTAGVTHISLEVAADNQIIPTLNEGKTLVELEESADNLVNRVNYDLFHDATPLTADDTITGTYDSATDYTISATTTDSLIDHTVGGDLTADSKLGLVGYKINTIVTNVDTLNNGLITQDSAGAAAANKAFIDAYNGVDGATAEHYGVNVPDFLGDISEINTSIVAAGGANFFENTANFDVTATTQSAFGIANSSFVDNGITIDNGVDPAVTYGTLLEWAEAQ